ncbi:MAG: Uma2 family endonuclease [Deltaproteobacteria bacterium]|nr:Uma2 family endonuclease [Deltaproteobacteria bacterium]
MTDLDGIPLESVRRLRRSEYDRMVDLGMFGDERVDLLDGILVVGHRASPPHAESVCRLSETLMPALRGRARILIRAPFAASEYSEPEPDLALVPVADYSTAHPASSFLVIEVADSSLRKDRALKGRLYARAAIPEYWIVDLTSRAIEVYRSPVDGLYTDTERYSAGMVLLPAAFPDVAVDVAALIP